jgi:branched-chain amino acid aminotransferase
VDAYKSGKLNEIFGTGTAAVIAPVKELSYSGFSMTLDTNQYKVSPAVKQWLSAIREGRQADTHGWMLKLP